MGSASSVGVLSAANVGDYHSRVGKDMSGDLLLGGNDLINVGGAIQNGSGNLALRPAAGHNLVLQSDGGVHVSGGLSLEGNSLLNASALDCTGGNLTFSPSSGSDVSVSLLGEGSTLSLAQGVEVAGLGAITGAGLVSNAEGGVTFQGGGSGGVTITASGGHAVTLPGGSAHAMVVSKPSGASSITGGVLNVTQGQTSTVGFVFHPQSGGNFSGQEPTQNTAGIFHKSALFETPRCLVEMDAVTSAPHNRVEGANLRLYSGGVEVMRLGDAEIALNAPMNMNNFEIIDVGEAVDDQDAVTLEQYQEIHFSARSNNSLTATGTIGSLTTISYTTNLNWGLTFANGQIRIPKAGWYAVTLSLRGSNADTERCRFITLQLRDSSSTAVFNITDSANGQGDGSTVTITGTDIIQLSTSTAYTLYYDDRGFFTYTAYVTLRFLSE